MSSWLIILLNLNLWTSKPFFPPYVLTIIFNSLLGVGVGTNFGDGRRRMSVEENLILEVRVHLLSEWTHTFSLLSAEGDDIYIKEEWLQVETWDKKSDFPPRNYRITKSISKSNALSPTGTNTLCRRAGSHFLRWIIINIYSARAATGKIFRVVFIEPEEKAATFLNTLLLHMKRGVWIANTKKTFRESVVG